MKRSNLLGFLLAAMLPMCMADDAPAASNGTVDPATSTDPAQEAGTTDVGEAGVQQTLSATGDDAAGAGLSSTSTTLTQPDSATDAQTTDTKGSDSAANAAPNSQTETSSTGNAVNATGNSTGDVVTDVGEPSSSDLSSAAGTADAGANADAGSAAPDATEGDASGEGAASDAAPDSASGTPSSAPNASTDDASQDAAGAGASGVHPHVEATGIVARLREAMLNPVEGVINALEADFGRLETLLEHLKNI
ncbi:hypothetical protein J4G52_25195 [Burkholderia cenocepacia]|uniref:hypothetical protein n=1 Tax=Burkholderia cenocepacia TaxID=95486 RepID=UPI001AA1171C|nr:hypothetical protein [Burkholderia cenocepacia]MBO1856839.1 hypothetical protein [Burkholderia cenocepacia]